MLSPLWHHSDDQERRLLALGDPEKRDGAEIPCNMQSCKNKCKAVGLHRILTAQEKQIAVDIREPGRIFGINQQEKCVCGRAVTLLSAELA